MHLTAYAFECMNRGMQDSLATDEFSAWFAALSEHHAEAVTRAITMLESLGTDQPRVVSVEVFARLAKYNGTPDTPMRELGVEGTSLHVIFAMEPDDRAVLLYGYDAERESAVPSVAQAMVAANVLRIYRASQRKAV